MTVMDTDAESNDLFFFFLHLLKQNCKYPQLIQRSAQAPHPPIQNYNMLIEMTPLRYRHAHVHSMASWDDKQRAFSGLFHTCASEWSMRRKASDKRAENEGKHL